ncbi:MULTISPECIES: MarR family transcriptional regulator [unclassified Enterococcus]|uniref:MarR family winged helix-turn-helix transcriptional regulator n=1 Tax=unclassified Enterococcus TaxID=2608891 RepID=UPI001556FCB7|nr:MULTISPECIES: MarR family transcriptional regulator [unclassified Enterococcus]MBS7578187.1 winged helix DNA-binding protein [Enterococcus sp. MMGLQ5-2]MBS7585437.1 winged helix DNA-binding protein [Enterococcus sp. MMGLQ5-1]NPD13294.1 winged helix DNA-binding protein [Enterococcus sp. MMGLQ5-1]NPD38018.1 winged helix DNA-binding protein [Enterococcus sp. MMGLQ5-2]
MSDYTKLAEEYLQIIVPEFRKNAALDRIQDYSRGEKFVLNSLRHSGGTASPVTLSLRLNSSAARITAIINRLEAKRFVTRKLDSIDKRKQQIILTEAGSEWIKQENLLVIAHSEQIFKVMGLADTKKFIELTEQYIEISKKINEGWQDIND